MDYITQFGVNGIYRIPMPTHYGQTLISSIHYLHGGNAWELQ